MGSRLTSDKVETEVPYLPRLRRRLVNSEPEKCGLNEDGGDNKRKYDLSDFSGYDMTLKELRERSKKKKKLLESSGLRKPNISTASCYDLIQDDTNAKIKEDESDSEKPLSVWKQKVSNKIKVEEKCIKKQKWSSLEIGVSEVITAEIHDGCGNLLSSVKSKYDPPDWSGHRNVACGVANASASEALPTTDICRELHDEMPKIDTGGDMDDLESNSISKEAPRRAVNEASFEYKELFESAPLSLREMSNVGEIRQFPQTINEYLPFCPLKLNKGGDAPTNITNHNLEEALPVNRDLGSDILESCDDSSFQQHISCEMDCDAAVQLPSMEYNDCSGPQEFICVSDLKGELDSSKDTSTHLKDNIIGNLGSQHISSEVPFPSSDPWTDANSVYDGSRLAENGSSLYENQSVRTTYDPISAGADEGVECLSMTCNASDGFTAKEVFESQNSVQLDCLPRRLLSARKAISPNSQEKLRRAMDDEELHDSVGKSRSGHEGAKVSPGQNHGKPKNNSNGLSRYVPKGILKASHASVGMPHDSTESSSIPTRAQKAVAFSQRQMQDIESLAMKLMNELKSMKDIVEENVCSKEYSSTPPKYTSDKMRTAIQNAAEVEETAKKWLSMMAKDCNRFCKIMRSTGKRTAAERKKLIFADEAGGELCHVKILDDHHDSVSVPESESLPCVEQA